MPVLHSRHISPGIVVLELAGSMTMGQECQRVELAVGDLIEDGERKVIMDLSRLEYLDSSGVGVIAVCSGRVDQAGGELRLAALTPKVIELLRVAKLDRLLKMYRSVDDAMRGWDASSVTSL